MAMELVWLLTALTILVTICIGVFKGILGDNIQYGRGPRDFLLDRLARYGDPFTMSLMGKTYTVISSPEIIKFVLSTAHASFPTAFPMQYARLFDSERISSKKRTQIRKIVLTASTGDELQKLVPYISSLAEKTIKSWEHQAVVNSVEELHKYAFTMGMHIAWRDVKPGSEEMDQIRNEFTLVENGLVALPINFPGFDFHKAMKAKQALASRIQSEISRRKKAGILQDDALNAFMNIGDDEFQDCDVSCTLMGLVFASSFLTAALIPWILKYLDDFPEVRQRVQEEQDCLREKMKEDKSLAWFKPKSSMPYTLQVVYEIMRIETTVVIVPRQSIKEVEYNGLIFPEGSYVWAAQTSLHHDPKYYPNPREFDPSRFVEKSKLNTFMPFGQGPHSCPGSEFALTKTLFIIHHLVTNYSWKRCGPDEGVNELPIRQLVGYPICLVKRDMT